MTNYPISVFDIAIGLMGFVFARELWKGWKFLRAKSIPCQACGRSLHPSLLEDDLCVDCNFIVGRVVRTSRRRAIQTLKQYREECP